MEIARDEINFFSEPGGLHQGLVVGEVVIHHGHHLAVIVTFDLNAVSIEQAEALGTDQRVKIALLAPIKGSIQQAVGHLLVIDRIKQIKAGFAGIVVLVKRLIFEQRNAADYFAMIFCHKEFRVRMLIKWML